MKQLSVFLCAILLVFGVVGTTNAAKQTEPSDLLQFTAAGHILGFQADGVYVASGDHMFRVEFVGSSGVAQVADQMLSENGQSHPLDRVTYPDLWPGISMSYDHVSGSILESTYMLEPGADVGLIQLRYNSPVEIESGGSLLIKYETGQMRESAPIAWQDIEGQRIPVEVAFCLLESPNSNPVFGFALGQYNPAYTLKIDPTLQWNTFMGSSDYDYAYAIAVDGSGNVYVVGYSEATWGSPVNPFAGSMDAFAAKLDSSGVLQWNTFMGTSNVDIGRGITLDGSGNIYVAGVSSTTWGSPVNAYSGGADAFVAKLDSSGALQWNTFMGSSGFDEGDSIAVDGSGNVYAVGYSWGTWGLPVNPYAGHGDTFAAKLDGNGALQWNTFMGSSSDNDFSEAIALDGSGNVYVVGSSGGTWGSPVNAHVLSDDAFVAKLDSSGALQWNTFMGSSRIEYGYSIAVDGSGSVYVAGESPATWGSPVNAHSGGNDAFAVKLDSSSGVLQWNTFMGSSNTDYCHAIAVDSKGNIYVSGQSCATWGSPVNPLSGGYDAFAAKLDSSGVLQWNTFMGSSSSEEVFAIAVDENRNLYLTGISEGTWGSPVNAYTGYYDAFVVKLVPTVTYVVPTLSEWGMITFFVLLVGSALWVIRRKIRQESK